MENENLLHASAFLCLSLPTEMARNREIDKIVIYCVVRNNRSMGFSVSETYEALQSEIPLRKNEVLKSILRCCENGSVSVVEGSIDNPFQARFRLSSDLNRRTTEESKKVKEFLAKSTVELLGSSYTENEQEQIENVLLEAITRLMARYGYAYASQITGLVNRESTEDFVPREELKKICAEVLRKQGVFQISVSQLEGAVGAVFDRRDPCLNNLAFSICRRYYSSRLLGLDLPIDFLSRHVFDGAKFFLDTNVLCYGGILQRDRHSEFRSVVKSSQKMGIALIASELSIAERFAKVERYRTLLETAEKILPGEVIDEVTASIMDASDDNSGELSESDFSETSLAESLSELGVEIQEFDLENSVQGDELEELVTELQDFDRKVRVAAKRKDRNALFHDAQLCWIVEKERAKSEKKTWAWFLTRDNSVIAHGLSRKDGSDPPYSMKIDTLLQTLFPFVEGQVIRPDFEDMFVDMIHRDVIPEDELFGVDELKMLVGVDAKALSVPPQDLRKAMAYVKREVLKGGGLTDSNRALAAQEMTKYLLSPDRSIIETTGRFERKLVSMEDQMKKMEERSARTEAEAEERRKALTLDVEKARAQEREARGENENLKERLLVRDAVIVTLILSFVLWFACVMFIEDLPAGIVNPILVFVASQLILIAAFLTVAFPKKRVACCVALGLPSVASIVLAFVSV